MSKGLAALLALFFALPAGAADRSRIEVIQLEVKPTVIPQPDAPAVLAVAPATRSVATPKAGRKAPARKQAHKKSGPRKKGRKSAG